VEKGRGKERDGRERDDYIVYLLGKVTNVLLTVPT
jgi:hypothetical protein